MPDYPSITCPVCQRTSYNANDIREGWCGKCKTWTQVPPNSKLPRNQMRRRVAPGIWIDAENCAHFEIVELLKVAGLEDTPENRIEVAAGFKEIIRELMPTTTIISRPEKAD